MPSRQAAPSAEDDNIMIRPMRGDGEQTRARIIETAGHLMAENGFAQTTSKSICEAAQVNMAAINYYFGSREGLYIACWKMCMTVCSTGNFWNAWPTRPSRPAGRCSAFWQPSVRA